MRDFQTRIGGKLILLKYNKSIKEREGKILNIEIANRLVKLRKEHNLSQEDLANKLGISRQAVSKWERAEASPDTDNLITLAKLYNVSLDELLYSEDDENDQNLNQNYEDENVRIIFDDKNDKKIIIDNYDSEKIKRKNNWDAFPYPLVMVILFFSLGFAWDLWGIAWLVFLTIPLYYSLGAAIRKRNASAFSYPVLMAIFYLFTGLLWSWWAFAWLAFVTIPIYYGIVAMFKNNR